MQKLWQFTDLHLYVRDNPAELDLKPNQTALAQSNDIIDACLAAFLAEPGCDTLLLTGDLTQTGHGDEHRALREKLRRVQAAGKRVIAITASHDYHTGGPESCHQLREFYAPFGLSGAVARYDDGQAYVARLGPGLRLLCVNDHGRGPAWLPWALDQIEQARAAGERIFGMTHVPTLPPSPIYPVLSPGSMFHDYQGTTRALADAGLRFMLTGHSHMHNIAPIATPSGNPYWDVNTSALVGWPGKFRQLEIEDGRVHITSREIPYVTAFGNLSAREYLQETFDGLLRDMFDGLDHDYDLFVRSVGTGMNPAAFNRLKWLVKPVGKLACRATLGGLARLLLCSIPEEARKLPLRGLLMEGMRNIYAGEEPYGPETGVGRAMMAYGRRLRFLGKKLGMEDFPAFLLSLVYDDSPDDEVTILLD
jgi:hypothetical protein